MPSAPLAALVRAAAGCLLVVFATGAAIGLSGPASASPASTAHLFQVPGEGDLEVPAEEGPEGDLPVEPGPDRPAGGAEDPVEGSPEGDLTPDEGDGDVSTAEDQDATDGSVDAENRRILLIVLGLVAVAIALSLLTIRYWRQTKPVRPAPGDSSDDLVDDVVDDDDGEADLFEPVTERRSRRAVAGADHADVDDLWVARGTGEHDRIEVTEAPAIAKPTSDQRAAAFGAERER